MIIIREYKCGDENDLSVVICRCLHEVNSRDYSSGAIETIASRFTPDNIKTLSTEREIFVVEIDGKTVGTASLSKDNRPNQHGYVCLTAFVLPDFHRTGIGTKLMNKVEDLVIKKGVNSLQVPSSKTAFEFYRKLGYKLLPGTKKDPNDVIWLVKEFRGHN